MSRLKEWLKRITFYEILLGMTATLKHLLHYHPVTFQYPYEKRVLSDNYRGMLPFRDTTMELKNAWAAICAKPRVPRA